MKKNLSSASLFALIVMICSLAACKDDDGLPTTDGEIDCTNCIRFDLPEVGQLSKYIRFKGENYVTNQDPKITYEPDTLIMEIVEKDGDWYVIDQYSTSNEAEKMTYRLKKDSDELLLVSESNLEYKLTLEEIQNPEANPKGWEIGLVCADLEICQGFLKDHEQRETTFEHLNVYKNYVPKALDGPGEFLLYTPELGIVRKCSVGSWVPTGDGWDLLTD